MKLKIEAAIIKICISSLFLMYNTPSIALRGDFSQPVYINSERQTVNLQKNTAIAFGNVHITQGTIKILASKVIMTRPNGDNKKMIIDAYGNLTTFYQMQDNNTPVQGSAQKIHYDLEDNKVELIGNACFRQLHSRIQCDRLIYLMQEQKIQASSNNDHRITTILMPSELQNNYKP
ncbi:lipopolysaccharide transport periplasmic protein LptA [Candidatus Erwinia haradaeae]|uniref:Lipopolysaccharide export system protein LptA n=1 Tax=Candidatus Erwinia haradaeae TaxID=1922217 RepID=A0A451DPP8_9GAMM|nr:lipopolysaccharide transport periplasmic protein LptA [Candidatus Erwinia haradaeae]VFP88656.1 Lipopolysaccharide export system protein LptA [Candidatus Erwinia haradaeae]